MKKLKIVAQIVIYAIVFYFIINIFRSDWDEIISSLNKINIIWALLSLTLITFSLTFQGYIWHKLLKSINQNIKFKNSFVTYFRSLITRYIPGGIWVFIARTYVTAKIGLNKQQSFYLIIVESVLAVLSGSIIFVILPPYNIYLSLLAGILIIFLLLFPWRVNWHERYSDHLFLQLQRGQEQSQGKIAE